MYTENVKINTNTWIDDHPSIRACNPTFDSTLA